jgi:glucosamine--fructose-6-phosphate aminotransferase (isomerizing)
MCGIVAAVADRNIVTVLIEGLNKLEYRGYDSAGLAISSKTGLTRLRSFGQVAELATQAKGNSAQLGIPHIRWATHGAPSERNAHPHISGGLAVVHNGIIENYTEIKAELQADGYEFTSDIDADVIAHLIHQELKQSPNLFSVVQQVTRPLICAYAIAMLQEHDNRIIVARHGAPLLIGVAANAYYAASDASALLQVTRNIIYLGSLLHPRRSLRRWRTQARPGGIGGCPYSGHQHRS